MIRLWHPSSLISRPHATNVQFSSKRLIVMERLEGVPLTDLESIRRVTKKDPEGVLIAALNCWFGSVVRADSFHADVHAGNLLVLRDGRVGFLDFGIVGRIRWEVVNTPLLHPADLY